MFTILEGDYFVLNVKHDRCLQFWRVTSLASMFSKNDVYNFLI